jgi:hypothetical protein
MRDDTAAAAGQLLWKVAGCAFGVISGGVVGAVAMIVGFALLGTSVETIIGVPLIVAGGIAPVFGGAGVLIFGAAAGKSSGEQLAATSPPKPDALMDTR